MSPEIKKFVKSFSTQMGEENVAIFAGAGLSVGAGFVDWATLLEPLAEELKLNITLEKNHLIRLAQYSVNQKGGNRHHLNEALITAFPVQKTPSSSHKILANLPIATYWTTNYDRLIETALIEKGKRPDVKHIDDQLPYNLSKRDAVVYKMHGDVEHAQQAVLTRDDYENYARNHSGFLNALSGDLTGKTFLFIGFSFSDPNLDQIFSQLRQRYHSAQREHYCLLRKPNTRDFEKDSEFQYASVSHAHYIKDLSRFNVTVLEIAEYSEIVEILKSIEGTYRRRSVFISGSVEDFSPWTREEVDDFVRTLGAMLVSANFRVVSGFGLGIGNALISGAIDQSYSNGQFHLDDFLDVRPFPRLFSDPKERAKAWQKYREDLLSLPGIAVFLFGNKFVEDKAVSADGVQKEFDIAISQGVIPLPVGGTGSMAKVLSDIVLENYDHHFPNAPLELKKLLIKLQQPTERLKDHLETILQALKQLAIS